MSRSNVNIGQLFAPLISVKEYQLIPYFFYVQIFFAFKIWLDYFNMELMYQYNHNIVF